MSSKTVMQIADHGPAASDRKTYQRPVLSPLGRLHVQTQGTGGMASDANANMTKAQGPSDPRIKENVKRIGDHPAGFGLYVFDYRSDFRDEWGHGRQFGVMADEVERTLPKAVSIGADGYKRVDYSMLGISRASH